MEASAEHITAHFKLEADLYALIEQREAEVRDLTAKNDELHIELTARDAKILELEHHLAIVERDAALHGISG